ncbi:MAG: efflux RND transporter permease subunit [Clostridiales bacterium]|nr:efflux RND transporter permease subunit [Clostridiales bacterium]
MMTKFSVKKPMTVAVAVILVLILGFVSFTKMQTDLLPSIDLPYAIVMTSYVGASPEEVEQIVSKPVEQSLATINNIKKISSVSSENVSVVILEFNDDVNMDSITIDIREKLDLIQATWKNDMIGTPMIMKLNPDMLPIMVAAIDVKDKDTTQISNYLNQTLLSKIESIEGVATVDIQGMIEEKVHVILNQEKIDSVKENMMSAMMKLQSEMLMQSQAMQEQVISNQEVPGQAMAMPEGTDQMSDSMSGMSENAGSLDIESTLTTDMISNILTAQNFEMPVGYITEDGRDYLVRVGDKLEDIEEISNLSLFDFGIPGLDVVRLSDVADVFKTDNSSEVYAKVNGNDAVIVSLNKQTSYSTAEVSKAIKDRFNSLMEENKDLHVTYLMDQGMYINIVVDSVLNNLVYGAILAVIILLLFLKDIRPTFIIACSIPISVIFAVVLMYFSGVTLNIISLSGLAVGVGMLVDNSIVVIENIYRLRYKGVSRIKAAVTGATQVAGAIISSTLTTVCVFLPIVFVEGMTRQLFTDMALTIGYSLLASLVVAVTLVPAMSANMLKKEKEKKHPVMDRLGNCYEKAIRFCIKHKAIVIILAIALLIGSTYAAISQGTEYMPTMDSTQVTVTMEMPEGTLQADAVKMADEVMKRIQAIDDVDTVGGMMSNNALSSMMGGASSSNTNVSVYAILKEDKKHSSEEIANMINDVCADLECEVKANGSSMDMSALGGSGISLNVRGEDMEQLQAIAKDIAEIIRNVEGTKDVSDGMINPDSQIKITVDKDKAIQHGLTVAQVYQAISGIINNTTTATTLRYEQVDYPIVVIDKSAAVDLTREEIKNYQIPVTSQDGSSSMVALSDIASIEEGESPSSIRRSEQQRYITVTAAIEEGYNIGLVSKDVEEAIKDYELPNGYEIKSSGEDKTINEAITELVKMLLLAIAFIYLIMVAQFQSLLSPFIVMFTIPLAFTGGFFGLFITGNAVSVISMIGFVMLSGIIVNNGIVLIDYINQLRLDGVSKKEALVEAGKTRMRPILMTALTTVLGLSTMALGVGMGSDMVQPIAIVTIGGLIYATITTLFVIPVLYDIFNRKELKKISEEELKIYEEL